ncbi:signal peptidase II [Desulfovibrio mangrovi]|uniref:signal peptidase II n=1 Tax=Desulfovibrio mangrovi TaxID=2976983 RepID=UPI002248025C|nr:signal peptidase II [Desulfovibrio mangrovi]UZP68503.1 signal peptidase II [Desulfovibrio mangrovi]
MRTRFYYIYGLGLLTALLDQYTKYWVVTTIPRYMTVTVIPGFFNLVNVRNSGAAFGFLNDPDTEWQVWMFAAAAVIAVGIINYLAKTSGKSAVMFTGLGLVLGGAIGNLIDRIRLQSVIDFLDFHVAEWHWPAFNVADIGICLGAGLIMLAMYKHK